MIFERSPVVALIGAGSCVEVGLVAVLVVDEIRRPRLRNMLLGAKRLRKTETGVIFIGGDKLTVVGWLRRVNLNVESTKSWQLIQND
jgi:hypothetical protein